MKSKKISLFLIGCIMVFTGCTDDSFKSSEKQITTFSINGINAIIDQDDLTVNLTMPYGTDVSALEPSIKISNKESTPTTQFSN